MMYEKDYTKENAKTIDQWVEEGWIWGIPISHEVYEKAVNGEWEMVLTPTKPVPKSWFPELKGKKILGLASGGGQQMPILRRLAGSVPCWTIRTGSLQVKRWWQKGKGTTLRLSKRI